MTGQVYLQRGDGDLTGAHGVEIGAGAGILFGAGWPYPLNRFTG